MIQSQITTTWGFWLLWGLAFLAFPIGGLAATALVGSVTSALRGAMAGLATGAVLGLIQWFVLKRQMPLPGTWILATCIGMATGLGLSVALLGSEMNGNNLLWRAAITGACIGTGQWLVLRQVLPQSAIWILVICLAWTLGWFVTRVIGVDLTPKWSVFGASGAITFQVLTGLTLYFLV